MEVEIEEGTCQLQIDRSLTRRRIYLTLTLTINYKYFKDELRTYSNECCICRSYGKSSP